MATSIASQLQKLKSYTNIEPQSTKRPFTRPSIIFNPKEAADIDLDTILSIALSGLEALAEIDSRFGNYKNSLFSLRSRDTDRELLGIEDNNKINESITSYLRLLSGHLQLHSSLKTLEYLIRRYKIYLYNTDELVLCALPYHDTHAFVRIVQLLNLGNSNWGFLEGVKVSGAPPPRKVLVQQCIRDMGVLDTLCKYASPMKKYQPSAPVVRFFTAVAVEFLGALPVIDSDIVRRILPFIFSGLEPTSKGGRDHKAGALMMVSLISNRVALAHKPVKALIESIAKAALQDAKESADLPWLRMLLMTMVSLVQSQSVEILPKKVLDTLQEIRDFAGVLFGLSKEFNIKKFLSVYLETLATYSCSEDFYHLALVSTIKIFPVKDFINGIVVKVLTSCLMLSKRTDGSKLSDSGCWAKKILLTIGEKYPSDLQAAVHKFLEDPKVKSNKVNSVFESLGTVLDGSLNVSQDVSDCLVYLNLEHPKAEIRRATLSSLAASDVLKSKTADLQILGNIQDAFVRRLHDEDLSVIQAALSLKDLLNIIDTPDLIGALKHVLLRCLDSVAISAPYVTSEACDVAIACLDYVILNLQNLLDYSEGVATMIFPLLLSFPKTWRLNMKAFEIAKQIRWPLYQNICRSYEFISTLRDKRFEPGFSNSVNMNIVEALAETFSANPEEYVIWMVQCAKNSVPSKTIFLLVILQSFVMKREDSESVLALFRTCFPFLEREWNDIESSGEVSREEEANSTVLDDDCDRFFNQLLHSSSKALCLNLLVCIFWRLLNAFVPTGSHNTLAENEGWLGALDTLFIFFTTTHSKNVFKDHIHLLVLKCNPSPVQFLSKFYTEEGFSVSVQTESLLSFATICSQTASSGKSMTDSHLQLLLGFPSILVPLSCGNKNIRAAAMKCLEALHTLCHQSSISAGKNGNDTLLQHSAWSPFLGEFLQLLVEQKRLILSDKTYLQSFLTAILGSSCQNILVPQNTDQRFDKLTKEAIFLCILNSALNLTPYGKLMVLSLLRGKGNDILHVEGVKSLLSDLMARRKKYHFGVDRSFRPLSSTEVKTLCFLLELQDSTAPSASLFGNAPSGYLLEALQVDGFSSEDPAVVQPCLAVLQKLNSTLYGHLKGETQDQLFEELVFLYRNDNAALQNAARDAILRVNVTFSTVVRLLDLVTAQEEHPLELSTERKKKKSGNEQAANLLPKVFNNWESRISFIGSLLDVLLLKKNIENRTSLVGPLFKLLSKVFADDWILGFFEQDKKCLEVSLATSRTTTSSICYIQQTVLTILDNITLSLLSDIPHKEDILDKYDVKLLLECAKTTKEATTRNHVFSLLSAIAKIMPSKVFEHIIAIFTIIGESATKQSDSHSQRVFEDLISNVVPSWLSKAQSVDNLLQIFLDVLPDVAEHRRLTIMVYLLRTLGERNSLASLIVLLIRSAIMGKQSGSDDILHSLEAVRSGFHSKWEFKFAMQVSAQYSYTVWLPSLVLLLKQVQILDRSQDRIIELFLAMEFIQQKMEDTELVFNVESGEDSDNIQKTLGALMEQIVSHLQLVNDRKKMLNVPTDVKKELKDCIHSALKAITKKMLPSSFFEGIKQLLGCENEFVKKKALAFLCETINNHDMLSPRPKEKRNQIQKEPSSWLHIDENFAESFGGMCSNIVQLINATADGLDPSVKLAAISSVEVLANNFGVNDQVFSSCLTSMWKQIISPNLAVSCSCIRGTGALINVVDRKTVLLEFPKIMEDMLKKVSGDLNMSKELKRGHNRNVTGSLNLKESVSFSFLVALEAIMKKFGNFLSPYLGDIIDLLVLYPEYVSGPEMKIKLKADAVRTQIIDKVPVRLTLTPVLNVYPKAVELAESSVSILFEMLASLIGKMERPFIGEHHRKLFETCLLALDLRRVHPESIKNVHVVEKCVLNAVIVLMTRITETMFNPLFIRSLEWSESEVDENGSTESRSLDRIISFYYFVNELAEHHRSLFVPYFKYLLEGCTRYLVDGLDTQSTGGTRKKKKAKIEDTVHGKSEGETEFSLKQWHLRALIISSLQKCFLYDTGSKKFLDSSNFQVLLKPIVSQLVVEPPNSVEDFPNVPSVNEVDDMLVGCLGQMAVTAGSDLLWKPLNHEVLMQTRSEKLRSRILGLRVVKYFVEHLKEEYLVLLPETIPFLGELLEDELSVKTLAQEILKEMETLSGESLRQYL